MKISSIAKNRYQATFLIGYLGLVVYWVFLHKSGLTTSNWNFLFSFLFGLVPLFAGIIGIIKSKKWGGLKSALGKSLLYTAIGLLLWGFGETVWSYYNFIVHQPAPYPSLADIGFGPSIFFWVLGAIYLSKASGARFAFKQSKVAKAFTVLALPLLLAFSYYLLVTKARGGILVPEGETLLKVILDIIYPFGDFLALTIATVILGLSFKYFGGRYRSAIVLWLIGLGVMFFADMVFSYTTTNGTFFNGDWGDLLLATGTWLISFGILGFATVPKIKASSETEEAK